MKLNRLAFCLGLLFAASTCFAQMYTITDLSTFGVTQSNAYGINNSGQVVGFFVVGSNTPTHAFRTAANSPINPATDDLGTPPSGSSGLIATGINASGQVVGYSWGNCPCRGFRTAANSTINPATDDLGTLGSSITEAFGINDSGQVVGMSDTGTPIPLTFHAFRTAPNSAINPATDDLGTLSGGVNRFDESEAYGINASGQAIGWSTTSGRVHAFRTSPNSAINPATDDLGTFGGVNSVANAINAFGQVVGWALTTGNTAVHAFRTAPNSPINPATDDLGTLGGMYSEAAGIDNYGEVVGRAATTGDVTSDPFLYSGGTMHDLNDLIPAGSGWQLLYANGVNDAGQIVGQGFRKGQYQAYLLTPVYKAFVRQPINADGSSVFSAERGVVPVKLALTQYNAPSCTLLPATIAITRAGSGTLRSVEIADPNFRIIGCQYHYNLAASSLGVGTYRVDISINGIMVGHAVFALK